jgi:hypothetical protein
MDGMMIKTMLSGCLLALVLISLCLTPLHSLQQEKMFTDRIPAQVLAAILLHAGGIGAGLIFTDKDTLSIGQELGQDETFTLYEVNHQIRARHPNVYMLENKVGWGRMLRPWLAGSVRGGIMHLDDNGTNTEGLSLEGGIQLFLWRKPSIKVFYDVGFGPCLTNNPLPSGGTKFNFASRFGLGVLFRVHPNVHCELGYRHVHISNGGLINGDNHNPGFDSDGAFSGMVLTF